MRRLFFSLLVLALTLPTFAQAKHPFTFEDMMKLKRVGEPEVSPDGKWVIFGVVDVDLEANTKTPHIWILAVSGDRVGTGASPVQAERSSASSSSGERILIPDQDGDRPRWTPDGKRFAFLSTKEGGSQIWVAEFDSGKGSVTSVHKLTSIATEASGELWSPDGKNILFISDVYPECSDEACNAKKLEVAEKSKVKALIFDHLLYRHWNAYKEGKRSHIFVIRLDACVGTAAPGCPAGAARDLTPGDYDSPVFSLGGQDDYAFSPDGQEICYTSNHDKNPAASTNNDLWIVRVATGDSPVQAKNITADNPGSDSTPLYSPDGRYIAYRAQQRPGYESDRFRLMLYDRKTGHKFEDKGESPIYSADITDVRKGTVTGGHPGDDVTIRHTDINVDVKFHELSRGFNDDLAVTPDGKTLLYTQMSLQYPSRIVRQTLSFHKDGEVVAWRGFDRLCGEGTTDNCSTAVEYDSVTHLNDSVLSQVAMSPFESFWFPGSNGDKVEGFIVNPPNFDASKKYPVKFLIHGGPQGAWGDDWSYRWNPELFAANGYVVIMINFHGSTGYGQKFIDAINGDWGGAPFEDLMKGLDYAEKTYPFIDKDRECALGASYGGYAINWILGHTDRFKCLVSHDGMFNAESAWGTTEELWFNDWEFKGTPYHNRASYEKWSPHQYAKNFKTPTLVIHGQRDYRLDVSEGFQLFTTLQMEGVPSKMLYFPDEGHWVLKPQNSRLWYKTVNDWVDQWTKE